MKTSTIIAGALVAALVPATAIAQKPPKQPKPNPGTAALTIAASPAPVVFTKPVSITGKLTGVTPNSGVTVRLEQDTSRPYGDAYKPTGATTVTTSSGAYAFTRKPTTNTQYRVVAQSSPPVTSGAKLVLVRPLVGLRVSTQSPQRGSLVRFSGIVLPARNGATVFVQRRTSTGGFLTVKRATLRASGTRSAYSTRVRIRSSGVYRVKLVGTQDLINGFSRRISMTTR